ncbi:uncharacterized protein LOC131317891 isoform X2 [Rhododendron vialii]|uniref:uncharacterized protein LOC131317891 isoform X2 n=1 Tax=Rhododendron vialii TaxID=182163 RepID=UPI00265F206A|nr:uncharacterized protein LOC131317891 isoform X2 [Rhododendron vialii]
MEPAKIDWETINSVFVKDELFEHINAPQWVDFSAPDEPIDDDAWFCRPDCNHPKTIEDFLQGTSPSKLQRSPTLPEILPLGDRNTRDAKLKRRGLAQPLFSSAKYSNDDRFVEDGENQNPNFPTTPSHQYNSWKAAIKSSTEKKRIDNSSQKQERPHLRRTPSARNLFGGRDILSQITDFCNDLKKLAMRAKESENAERGYGKKSPVVAKKWKGKECDGENIGELDVREKERKPLLEVNKEKCEIVEKSNVKEKLRRKKAEEAENIPISLDVKNVNGKEGDVLSQIRICPPSPQCFTVGRAPSKATPLKASRSRPLERRILGELDCCNTELPKEEAADNNNCGRTASIVAEREPRTLDVFWFLKPCTLSSYS